MRILALVTDGLGAGGGIARFNSDLVDALATSNQVGNVVLVPRAAGSGPRPPVKVCQVEPQSSRLLWAAQAARLAARVRPDIIFCGHLHAAPLAAALARLWQARLWVHVHGIEAWVPRDAVVKRCLGAAHLITSASRFTRRRLLEWVRIEPERVRVLPNTVGRQFMPRPRRPELMARYGLAGRKVILTVGRLSSSERYKGHDRIIRVLAGVARKCGPLAYLIVGSGDDRVRLETLARNQGGDAMVVFAGYVGEAELPDHFALGDVYAMPSTGEGFGIVFLEAAASGLSVIGGNRDGAVDALAGGRLGRLINPESPEELRLALVAALQQSGPSGAGPGEIVAQFRFENFASHVDDLLSSMMTA